MASTNPFSSMTDAEYELMRALNREDVEAAVKAALSVDCARTCKRVTDLQNGFGRMQATNVAVFLTMLAVLAQSAFHLL